MGLRKRETSFSRGRLPKNNRNGIAANAGIITYILLLAARIPLSRLIGDAGIGLLAPALELYMLAALLFSYGISRTMTGLIRYRMKRGQYKNAGKVFWTSLKISLFFGILAALLTVVFSGFLAENAFLEAMSGKALLAAAPIAILSALISVFRGHFNGNGFAPLVVYSLYIEKTAMLIAGIVGGRFYYDYGKKVSALLKNDMAACAYGAQGVMFGIMAAELLTLIYLLVVFIFISGSWKRQMMQDSGKRIESNGELTGMLLGNGFPMVLFILLTNSFMMIDQRFFNYCMNRKEQGGIRTALWGAYYGKYAALIGIGAALVCLAVHSSIGKIAAAHDREEYRVMRERIGLAVKKACVVAFPVAVILAVLAESFVTGLYKGENEQAIAAVRQGTAVVFFYGIAYLFGQMMLKIRMIKELLLCLAIAFAVHVVAAFLLVQKGLLGVDGIVYSLMLYTVTLAVLLFVLVSRRVGYKQEWIYSVVFPAGAAAVSGLAVMLLNKILFVFIGALPTLLISCLVGLILYMVLIILLHVINEGELSEMPLGGLWVAIGRLFGVL